MTVIEKTYDWVRPLYPRLITDCVVIHHAAAKTATPDDINQFHVARGWSGIGYHYYVRKNGTIYRGRPEDMTGGHTANENYHTIGICFEGNFMDETMSDKQLEAGQWLIEDIKTRYPHIDVKRHKDFNPTGCPGTNFPFEEMINDMTQERYNEMYEAMMQAVRKADESAWSDKEGWWDKATATGVVNGTAPKAPITREELIAVLGRVGLIK